MKSIDAGKLRDRVRIERQNLIDNKRGGRVTPPGQPAWLEVVTVWGECIPLRGGEALQNLVQRSTQLWKVTIRARQGLGTGMRLVWTDPFAGEVIANIKSITSNEARDGLIITAESGVPT